MTDRPEDDDSLKDRLVALTRDLVPGMKERRWGRVIYISSMMGVMCGAGRSTYSATKTALLGLARAGAIDLAPFGITVNCLAPGWFKTAQNQVLSIPKRFSAPLSLCLGTATSQTESSSALLTMIGAKTMIVVSVDIVINRLNVAALADTVAHLADLGVY